ncbi:hypothetical protein CMT84_05645 [Elizabethkingia anophelis]|nr:hypothetical protein [Elizabethkingia anophelis]
MARYWVPEYGSSEDIEAFGWMKMYSPYHNICPEINVLSMLITSGVNETRVDPIHAKKFVAALQDKPGQVNPIILHRDYNSGYGSGQNTKQSIDNYTFYFEFIMNQFGM